MKIFSFVLITFILFAQPAGVFAGGVVQTVPIKERFLQNELSMEKYFSQESIVKEKSDLQETIYEYETKSPFKAFVFSLAVPGAGQYYTGSKTKAAAFLAVDALLWTGYLIYHDKGSDKEEEYEGYAQGHYSWAVFMTWWNSLPDSVQKAYSHRLPWDEQANLPVFNHEYYENIGKYDQFQVGWDDIGINNPPPSEDSISLSPHRIVYLDMRKQSNDYFSNATTMAMISIANHIISAFEAAISAKKFNKGSKQYSLRLSPKKINGRIEPYLTFTAKF